MKRIKESGAQAKSVDIELGGYVVTVGKMTVGQVCQLLEVMEKYIGGIASGLSAFSSTGDAMDKFTGLLSKGLAALVPSVPEDALSILEIVFGVSEEDQDWFEGVEFEQLIDALPELDKLNDFGNLWEKVVGTFRAMAERYKSEK